MRNVISVDVEEYFHSHEVSAGRDQRLWAGFPARVETATARVLELFDAHRVRGTFFILGWVAERYPRLVRRIAAAGHEIGCHSHLHRLVYELSPEEFRSDTLRAQAAIADACGTRPRLYRAPSYSITRRSLWALEILAECGFTHDSSIYPIRHDRYGIPGSHRHPYTIPTPSGPILEVPPATVRLAAGVVTPVGGGAYLRLFSYRYTAAGIRLLNRQEQHPACIYFHPWEMDPEQPRLATGVVSRLRTYTGVAGMRAKLDRLLSEFRFTTMSAIHRSHPRQQAYEALAACS